MTSEREHAAASDAVAFVLSERPDDTSTDGAGEREPKSGVDLRLGVTINVLPSDHPHTPDDIRGESESGDYTVWLDTPEHRMTATVPAPDDRHLTADELHKALVAAFGSVLSELLNGDNA